jgi:hypothetical protein
MGLVGKKKLYQFFVSMQSMKNVWENFMLSFFGENWNFLEKVVIGCDDTYKYGTVTVKI